MVLKSLFGKKANQAATGSNIPAAGAVAPGPVGSESASLPAAAAAQSGSALGEQQEPPVAAHLEEAMLDNARIDSQESRDRVYQELLFSDLLLALADVPEGQTPSTDPGSMSIAILSNGQGMNFAAAFTSAEAARRWRNEGGQYVSVRGQDIFKLLEPSPADVVVINPGSAPFIVLPKVDYRQLAMGVVPQNPHSPVQSATAAPTGESQRQGDNGEGQMQVAFPPDVFSEEQKAHSSKVMEANPNIEAAVLGAILPPGAPEDGWLRTVFLRVSGLEENQDAMQAFCMTVREKIVDAGDLFKDVNFEVGVMPDPAFWDAMHQNKIILFDKNPSVVSAGGPAGGGNQA